MLALEMREHRLVCELPSTQGIPTCKELIIKKIMLLY